VVLHVAQSLFHDHVPAKREGLPSVWINCRHTGNLNASRAQLGHANESMTINYTQPKDERGLDAVDAAYTAQVVPLRRREAP
jgi:2-haloacid dehalogenase